jgi:putative FmdB family regulatory protein
MPLYEYECESCGHRFERIQKFSDPIVEECPKCGGKVQKLLSTPAIQFKGSGWYITDYARKDGSGKTSEKADKPSEGDKAPAAAADAKSSPSSGSTSSSSGSTDTVSASSTSKQS